MERVSLCKENYHQIRLVLCGLIKFDVAEMNCQWISACIILAIRIAITVMMLLSNVATVRKF